MNEENSNSKSNGCCQRDSVANPLERNPISRTIKTSQPTHCSTALKEGILLFKRKNGIQIRNSLFLRNFRYSYVANPYSSFRRENLYERGSNRTCWLTNGVLDSLGGAGSNDILEQSENKTSTNVHNSHPGKRIFPAFLLHRLHCLTGNVRLWFLADFCEKKICILFQAQ